MSSRLIFLLISLVTAWVLALNSGHNLAFNLAYLLTGVLVLSYAWAWNSVRAVGLRRFTRTRRSQVGQFAEEQFEVTNRSLWPKLWLEVRDQSTLPWHYQASRVISSLGRHASQRWQVKTLCTQRGRFRLGPLVLRSGDPLGIFETEQKLADTGFVVVYPLTVELTSFEPTISDLSGGEARHRRTYQLTSNVAGVRDYVHGDSLNRIHWPSTARARRLMTKEFELDPTADIWLYLDLYQGAEASAAWEPTPPEPSLFVLGSRNRKKSLFELPPITTEYAVTVTASLARFFLLRNRAVGMSSRGRGREFLQADRGERQLGKILEALAVVEAGGTVPLANLIATEGVRLNRNDTIIAVSADPSPAWAVALQQLQRRGVNSVAVVIDGTTFERPQGYEALQVSLEAAGIPTYKVRRDDPIDQALAQPARTGKIYRNGA
ncbi:MAG: DUF58 domain-containing protein [Chloroflexota bacterium]|nr:DUF58 domain-containing protein [Chloroflexota bacterium]